MRRPTPAPPLCCLALGHNNESRQQYWMISAAFQEVSDKHLPLTAQLRGVGEKRASLHDKEA